MTRPFQSQRGAAFLAMHRSKPGFILPNAWDAGSAVLLAEAGFRAIATTSAGIAFSLGKPDYQTGDADLAVSREAMFARIGEIVDAVRVPVSADLEAGYGHSPEAVADTIARAIELGLAGGNIEDRVPSEPRLYDEQLSVERIRAARKAIDARGGAFVLNARTDVFLVGGGGLETAIRRANLYREAGADCIFTPGATDIGTIRTLAREITAPLNIVAGLGNVSLDLKAALEAGVQRISVGGSIARAAFGLVREAAKELRDLGPMTYTTRQIPQGELSAMFAKFLRA